MSTKKYTKEELIQIILDVYKSTGKVPTRDFFRNKSEYPCYSVFVRVFGSWNSTLENSGLNLNKLVIRLNGNERCSICNTTKLGQWHYTNENILCRRCYSSSRGYYNGDLNPNSTTGMGIITEHVVFKVLSDCIKCNTDDNFHSDFDLISEKYGSINVKSGKIFKTKKYNDWKWSFLITKVSKIPDVYICIGFNIDKTNIEHVWIIPSKSEIISKTSINISIKNIERAFQYEVDVKPYNELYRSLDIYLLPEFCNLKPKIEGELVEQSVT